MMAVEGGSYGLQIGGEATDYVLLFMNPRAATAVLRNKVKLGATASAAAGPVGRHASANTDWKLDTEILTYSRAKGAFAGATLEGASVQRDDDSTQAIYGSKVATEDVLSGKVSVPESAQAFLAAVKGAKAVAKSD